METQKENRLESHLSTSSTRHHHHHHLPQEIVEQIMIKLPAKSILRFKCVSKSWRLLASSDRFVKAHLEESSKDKSLERHHIVFGSPRAAEFNYPTCGPEDSALIVGSCNGLLCILKNNAEFILWNPTTRKFRNLPPFSDDAQRHPAGPRHIACASGFGFDESNDDYKVIRMWKNSQWGAVDDVKLKRLAKMYSSKTDSWREVDDPVLDRHFGFDAAFGRFASGKLHWEVYGRGDEGWSVVYFDLKDETFGTEGLEGPRKVNHCKGWSDAYIYVESLVEP